MTRLCCSHKPILIRDWLAFICDHTVPRRIHWPEGDLVLHRDGTPVTIEELQPIGEMHTDSYGWLRNYDFSEAPHE